MFETFLEIFNFAAQLNCDIFKHIFGHCSALSVVHLVWKEASYEGTLNFSKRVWVQILDFETW